jgi:hypothetical protein
MFRRILTTVWILFLLSGCVYIPLLSSKEKGNDGLVSFSLLASLSQPGSPFSILSVLPEDKATEVPLNTAIQWEFSSELSGGTMVQDFFRVVSDNQILDGEFVKKKNFVLFLPDNNLSNGQNHEVTVFSGLGDSQGRILDSEYRSLFTTQNLVDTTPPTVTSVSPTHLSSNNSLSSPVVINFSEAILNTSVDSTSMTVESNGVPISQIGQSSLTFIPNTNWTPFMDVDVTVNPSILDLASNSLLSPYTFSFSIVDSGNVTVFAGSDLSVSGNMAGTGTAARFSNPSYLAIDGVGNLFVSDTNNCSVKRISSVGVVSFYAGSNSGLCGYVNNANGLTSRFNYPQGIAINVAGSQLFVTDKFTHTVRRILTTATNTVTTNNGNNASANTNGNGTTSRFSYPEGLVLDPAGIIYVTDTGNCSIRRISGTTASTLAGTAPSSVGVCGYVNATGTTARFSAPRGLAVDAAGNVFVADTGNCAIRRVTSAGVVTTFAGPTTAGNCGFADGTTTDARFNQPQGITIDPVGNLFVTDTGNCAVRKITPAGVVTTYAGGIPPTPSCGNVNSTKLNSRFNNPKGIVRDAFGNLFITDTLNHSIKKIEP